MKTTKKKYIEGKGEITDFMNSCYMSVIIYICVMAYVFR